MILLSFSNRRLRMKSTCTITSEKFAQFWTKRHGKLAYHSQTIKRRSYFPKTGCPGIVILSNTSDDPKLRGMEIVGAPVGAPEFCSAFVAKTLNQMLRESE